MTEQYAELVEKGLSYRLCAQHCGISEDSPANWMRDALDILDNDTETAIDKDAKKSAIVGFFRRVKKAEAVAAERALEHIDTAAEGGAWQAAAWLLERRYPDDYGRERVYRDGEDLRSTAIVIPGLLVPEPKQAPTKGRKRKAAS